MTACFTRALTAVRSRVALLSSNRTSVEVVYRTEEAGTRIALPFAALRGPVMSPDTELRPVKCRSGSSIWNAGRRHSGRRPLSSASAAFYGSPHPACLLSSVDIPGAARGPVRRGVALPFAGPRGGPCRGIALL
jgi:hypothetical protein